MLSTYEKVSNNIITMATKMRLPILLLVGMLSTTITAQEYECRLSSPIPLAEGVTLEQVKNSELGTYTMRLSYKGGQAWVGIGINTQGDDKMAPGTAVIGRIEEDGSSSVLKYSLSSDEKDGSGVLPVTNQNLLKASFVQTETESTLTFTQRLNDDGVTITDSSSWIFAAGLPDNQWEGKHKVHGSFSLPLTEDCDKITQKPTPTPTTSPTTMQPTGGPTTDETAVVEPARAREETETVMVVSNTQAPTTELDTSIQVEAELEALAFEEEILIDEFEQSNSTYADTTVIAPTSSTTHDDSLLSPTSVAEVTVSTTTSTTTTESTSPGFSTLVLTKDETKATHPLWVAHGWTLAVAWGILAPLAIGAAMLRHTIARYADWYSLHLKLNLLVVALTIVGFALAVAATKQEGKPHFQKQNHTLHNPIGLAVFILVIFQTFMGYVRPAAPQPAPTEEEDDFTELGFSTNLPPSNKTAHAKRISMQEKMLHRVGISCNNLNPSASEYEHKRASLKEKMQVLSTVGFSTHNLQSAKPPPKTSSQTTTLHSSMQGQAIEEFINVFKIALERTAWEMLHRLMGAVLIGLAWYACHSGYRLMEEIYDQEDNHTTAFWGFTGGIAGTIFLLVYVGRMR